FAYASGALAYSILEGVTCHPFSRRAAPPAANPRAGLLKPWISTFWVRPSGSDLSHSSISVSIQPTRFEVSRRRGGKARARSNRHRVVRLSPVRSITSRQSIILMLEFLPRSTEVSVYRSTVKTSYSDVLLLRQTTTQRGRR